MLEELRDATNYTLTENGAVTYESTLSHCLDLFATVGALRHVDDEEIVLRFKRAYAEDRDLAMKILFFARDIRGGLGERRVFRTILDYLARKNHASVDKNIHLIAEYGRYDDLLCLLGTPCEEQALAYIAGQYRADLEVLRSGEGQVSLLGKWLPSVNASNPATVAQGKRIAKYLGIDQRAYRKSLTALRAAIHILENSLRTKDYTFDYAKQPSRAMLKYRRAFWRNDGERYGGFLESVERGAAQLHTATLYPHDVIAPLFQGYSVRKYLGDEERRTLDVTWNAQRDFTHGENALVVLDGSGSMYSYSNPMPEAVGMSLAIYFAERNRGEFRNHFITFSESPRLVEIKGSDIAEKVEFCESFNECANTDIHRVFELVLRTALEHDMKQEDLPGSLYFITDMEFDECAEGAQETNFRHAKRLFEEHGYKLPQVVFWNVSSRNSQQPVTMNEQGVVLVSGSSPQVFSMLEAGDFSPLDFMLKVLGSPRYAAIAA